MFISYLEGMSKRSSTTSTERLIAEYINSYVHTQCPVQNNRIINSLYPHILDTIQLSKSLNNFIYTTAMSGNSPEPDDDRRSSDMEYSPRDVLYASDESSWPSSDSNQFSSPGNSERSFEAAEDTEKIYSKYPTCFPGSFLTHIQRTIQARWTRMRDRHLTEIKWTLMIT